ncbi:hypothetical protein D4764_0104710 [Takifugu flavidus]|uniref:Uncharacterized protein n=1 Tax=Takifugu flavidus TaxID=433684 RepID=A0A5C6MHP8_9TELE|nr:hypothetical protein D4764_0104710 [Takifugu flavidus]
MRTDKLSKRTSGPLAQQNTFGRQAQLNQASVGASFQAAPLIASSRKPFTDGEFVKKCINAVAEVVCPEKKDVFNAEGGAPAPPMGHPPLQLKLRGSRASFGQRLEGRKRPAGCEQHQQTLRSPEHLRINLNMIKTTQKA